MTRHFLLASVLAFYAVLLASCYAVEAPTAPTQPPPVTPVDPPPGFPPPTTPPPEPPPTVPPPADVAAFLERIVIGATVTEAEAAVGQRGNLVPASGPAPATLRWQMPGFMVYAVIVNGKVTAKKSSPVETPPEAP